MAEFVGETFGGAGAMAEFGPFCALLCDFTAQFTATVLEGVEGLRPHSDAIGQTHAFHRTLARVCAQYCVACGFLSAALLLRPQTNRLSNSCSFYRHDECFLFMCTFVTMAC